jgi:hypothetical protein
MLLVFRGMGFKAFAWFLLSLSLAIEAQEPQNVQEFSAWLKEKGIEAGKVRVVEDAGGGMGRGVVATSEIKEGELLFRIPMKWVMHEETARKLPQLGEALARAERPVPGQLVVALMLMFEDCKRGKDSASATCPLSQQVSSWRPYLDILPRNFSAPMFWTRAELEELKGSQIMSMHQADVREFQQSWSALQDYVLKKDRTLFCKECFNVETFKWASWNINSRALTLQGVKFLIPLADLVNYEPEDRDTQRRNHQELFLKYHQVSFLL